MFVYMNLDIYANGYNYGIQDFLLKHIKGPWLRDLRLQNVWNMNIDKELLDFCTSPRFVHFADFRFRPMTVKIAAKVALHWQTSPIYSHLPYARTRPLFLHISRPYEITLS
ncbi:hypothetical protein L596_010466 [Steinernema carpocapsae]|uniref:F-box associated domain-containing protein n=1 Tax=Steinernema carpocapsae TaxID=34508 RepID=A0A4U5PJ58_STECR|nr:hypothetical protein L596_010466 [Steinernema carpocapsae]